MNLSHGYRPLLILFFFIFLVLPVSCCDSSDKILELIAYYADFYRVDRGLALNIARAESSLDPLARGKAGERGLYQIMPETWKWLSLKIYGKPVSFAAAYDPEINIRMALWYVRFLQDSLGDEFSDAAVICAYNMGLNKLKSRGYRLPGDHKNDIYRRYFKNNTAARQPTVKENIRRSATTSTPPDNDWKEVKDSLSC